MEDRRRELRKTPRRPLRYAASLTVAGQTQRIPCVLWDISESGARIAAAHVHELPHNFVLVLTGQVEQRRCEVVWRDRRFVGVKFLR